MIVLAMTLGIVIGAVLGMLAPLRIEGIDDSE